MLVLVLHWKMRSAHSVHPFERKSQRMFSGEGEGACLAMHKPG